MFFCSLLFFLASVQSAVIAFSFFTVSCAHLFYYFCPLGSKSATTNENVATADSRASICSSTKHTSLHNVYPEYHRACFAWFSTALHTVRINLFILQKKRLVLHAVHYMRSIDHPTKLTAIVRVKNCTSTKQTDHANTKKKADIGS